jgi:large subunit ribosomal protein L25
VVGSAVEVALSRDIRSPNLATGSFGRVSIEPRRRIQPVSATPTVLTATSRIEIGKGVAHLRKSGRVPAVVFGHGIESIPVSLDAHEFDHLRKTIHSNSIVSLVIDGKDKHRVLVHGIQIDPRYRRLLHVDLFALKSGEEVTVDIPVHTTGESYAVARLGGMLLHNLDHVRVRALPEKLPESFEVSIDSLNELEAAIHLRDLPVPEGVTLLTDLDEIVVKVATPHVVEEPVAEVVEETTEEAAAAAAAAGAEGKPAPEA